MGSPLIFRRGVPLCAHSVSFINESHLKLVSNDTMESLRHVVRWRPFVSARMRNQPDPTRWLPADYSPSTNRPVVQRRPNLRRLPKWRPPTEGRPDPGSATWPGRWSLVRTNGILGVSDDESVLAEVVARQWLDRYGVVTRDWWKREHPTVTWRATPCLSAFCTPSWTTR